MDVSASGTFWVRKVIPKFKRILGAKYKKQIRKKIGKSKNKINKRFREIYECELMDH